MAYHTENDVAPTLDYSNAMLQCKSHPAARLNCCFVHWGYPQSGTHMLHVICIWFNQQIVHMRWR